MIDDKKIEAAANKHIETEYARYNSGEVEEEMICLRGKDSFKAGAKWMQEEFLNGLWHPASEEPKENFDLVYINKKLKSSEKYLAITLIDLTIFLVKDGKLLVECLVFISGLIKMIYCQRKEVSNESICI